MSTHVKPSIYYNHEYNHRSVCCMLKHSIKIVTQMVKLIHCVRAQSICMKMWNGRLIGFAVVIRMYNNIIATYIHVTFVLKVYVRQQARPFA